MVTAAVFTNPVVWASRAIRTDALIDVSVIVTASFPKPVIVPAAPAI